MGHHDEAHTSCRRFARQNARGARKAVSLEFVDNATFDDINDINFKSANFTVQKALPLLQKGSTITFVAFFLSSSDSSYITGADIDADGGFSQI